MTARHIPALVVLLSALTGFTHAALTDAGRVTAPVQCYEDGSCDNGYCDPLALCGYGDAR